MPPAVVTMSLASRPAGLGEVLLTSTRIVLSAPGLSCAVTSADLGWSQPPVPAWPLMTRLPLIVNMKKSSAVAISSAFSTLASAGSRNEVTNRRWPWGLFGPLSPACQIHLAPSSGASGSSIFRAMSEPIHSALRPVGRFEQAHRSSAPACSRPRACRPCPRPGPSSGTAGATGAACPHRRWPLSRRSSTRPLSQRSPWSRARLSSSPATRT